MSRASKRIGGSFGPKWRPHLERRNGEWVVRYVLGLITSLDDLDRAERWADKQNARQMRTTSNQFNQEH